MKKIKDIAIIIGVLFNFFLVLFFFFLYNYSIPREGTDYIKPPDVVALDIKNKELENNINSLNKVDGIPIFVEPSEIGKENPYNP